MAKKRSSGLYDYEPVKGLVFSDEVPESISMTQQCFKDESDIHYLIERFENNGSFYDRMQVATRKPQFGDFSDVDYQSLQNTIAQVNNDFSLLPGLLS